MAPGARTQLVGLIGWPVSHSRSPAMHNAAFAALGLDWAYLPLPVALDPAERIGEAVRGLRALGLRGANVTVPHKQAVLSWLDELTPVARAMGAVNTIAVESDGRLLGDNTDARGFASDLRQHGVDPSRQRVLVLGAGGSARAIVYALAELGAAVIVIANRTPDRAQELAQSMQPLFPGTLLSAVALDDAVRTVGPESALIVNSTSLGMTPNIDSTPWDESVRLSSGQVVYDLVYAPQQTRLLRMAQEQGARAIGGLGMLVWQGALAFERWTGVPAPVEVMRSAAERAGAVASGQK